MATINDVEENEFSYRPSNVLLDNTDTWRASIVSKIAELERRIATLELHDEKQTSRRVVMLHQKDGSIMKSECDVNFVDVDTVDKAIDKLRVGLVAWIHPENEEAVMDGFRATR